MTLSNSDLYNIHVNMAKISNVAWKIQNVPENLWLVRLGYGHRCQVSHDALDFQYQSLKFICKVVQVADSHNIPGKLSGTDPFNIWHDTGGNHFTSCAFHI